MTIRIDDIERRDQDGHYFWRITMKGLHGQGVYCGLQTGADGYGLYFRQDAFDSWTELLSAGLFYAHPGLNAEQVAHRVAACLVCIGWGPELYNDRDSITSGRPMVAFARGRSGATS